ncbi:hypothetical protein [Mesoterricola silvestris]|uniref:Uncharacterized protein n=1 Tax=Mesoterricola silvestris TaxID=2927979 RepID=A0AA48GMH3_9BACT|nr:hypothetical protein [Mesoterricola silvestris]BDU74034.1 hypothetical protein METEAL_32080 [Mesoterricola silvestris]
MNRFVLAILLCPSLTLAAQSPARPAPQPGSDPILVGDYRPTPVDQPQVREAKDFLQQKLPGMTLLDVTRAYTQVVAGLNVKLQAKVLDEEGTMDWEFVAFQGLDGTWHLTSANRI